MPRDKGASVYFDRVKNEFIGIDEDLKNSLRSSYPDKELDKELSNMKAWLCSPRGKKRKGTLQFILNWLGNGLYKINEAHNLSLDELQLEYLEEIWSKSHHLLVLNTKV